MSSGQPMSEENHDCKWWVDFCYEWLCSSDSNLFAHVYGSSSGRNVRVSESSSLMSPGRNPSPVRMSEDDSSDTSQYGQLNYFLCCQPVDTESFLYKQFSYLWDRFRGWLSMVPKFTAAGGAWTYGFETIGQGNAGSARAWMGAGVLECSAVAAFNFPMELLSVWKNKWNIFYDQQAAQFCGRYGTKHHLIRSILFSTTYGVGAMGSGFMWQVVANVITYHASATVGAMFVFCGFAFLMGLMATQLFFWALAKQFTDINYINYGGDGSFSGTFTPQLMTSNLELSFILVGAACAGFLLTSLPSGLFALTGTLYLDVLKSCLSTFVGYTAGHTLMTVVRQVFPALTSAVTSCVTSMQNCTLNSCVPSCCTNYFS
jgi:hypothetical protein